MNNRFNCIYRIVFSNGKSYVGQARNLKKRISQHINFAKSNEDDCPKLNNALRAHNFVFDVEILAENIESFEERNELERKYISDYNSIDDGYNITNGGEGCIDVETGRHIRYNKGKYKRNANDVYDYNKQRSLEDKEYRKYLNKLHGDWNKSHPSVMRKNAKNWYKKHPEYHKLYNKEHAEEIKRYKNTWRLKNREKCNEYAREWRRKRGVLSIKNKHRTKLHLDLMFDNVPNKDDFYRIYRSMFGGGRTVSKNFVFPRKKVGFLNEWGNWLHE